LTQNDAPDASGQWTTSSSSWAVNTRDMALAVLSQNSSDYFEEDDSAFLDALEAAVLPGDVTPVSDAQMDQSSDQESSQPEPPPPSQPSLKRRRLEAYEERANEKKARLERVEEDQAVYGASRFGGWGEYMRRKRAKLQIQNQDMEESDEASEGNQSKIFKGLSIYVGS
jgi:DNA repair protein REV1